MSFTGNAIEAEHVSKSYPLYKNDWERLRALLSPSFCPKQYKALDDISFTLKKGSVMGIIGLNGSGKSTLSAVITGITYPEQGSLRVNGEVSMLAAQSGLNPYLTGVQNIYNKCTLMGFKKSYINDVIDDIIQFADIGQFIYQPLKNYSSGMKARLGFSISIHMNPEVLIIDESLAVGDGSFTDKCIIRMQTFKKEGKSILFVSHSVNQMQEFCDEVLWLHKGKKVGLASPERILMPYCGFVREFNTLSNAERERVSPIFTEYQEKYV